MLLISHHSTQRTRGNKHLPASKPVSHVGDQITNRPKLVIEKESLYLTYFTVKAVQSKIS